MNNDRLSLLFRQYRTRGEVRRVLLDEMVLLLQSNKGATAFPADINALATGSDRDVIDSFGKAKAFRDGLKGTAQRSVVGSISIELCELFATALERMKDLPPEGAMRSTGRARALGSA